MKTLVIYRSISGFTQKYAQWIAQELNADTYDARDFDPQLFSQYQVIIFGGSLHAVGINGVKVIKQNLSSLADKKIIVFAVGASPPRENILDEVKNKNFTAEEQEKIAFFYLRGGFNFSKLNKINKILMAFFRVRIALKKHKTPDEIGMLAAYVKPIDCAKKENIQKIISYTKSLTSQ